MQGDQPTNVRPLPPRPTTEYIQLVGERSVADLRAMADIFQSLGRSRANIDRLMDAEYVIADMLKKLK